VLHQPWFGYEDGVFVSAGLKRISLAAHMLCLSIKPYPQGGFWALGLQVRRRKLFCKIINTTEVTGSRALPTENNLP